MMISNTTFILSQTIILGIEAVAHMCSLKEVFLEISQNSQ